MRLLLCGATGFIGAQILDDCLKHNYITHIYCLTRHQLARPYATHQKVTQLILDDWDAGVPDYMLDKLAGYGVEGCIWAVGNRSMRDFKSRDEAEKVWVQMPVQAAEAFAARLATRLDPARDPRKSKFPFRFVFVSQWGAEEDQFRSLWIWAESRKLKGAAEKALFEVAENSEEKSGKRCFEVIALRPGTVIGRGDAIGTIMTEAVTPSVAVDRLSRAAVRTALQGTGEVGKRVLENRECLGEDWASVNTLGF